MPDSKYCYPNSTVLINKLNITNAEELFEAEVALTSIRLEELELKPIEGNFDFHHLKKIHHYIFQDLYDWAGKIRTVEIGKGNLFCTTACIPAYADSVFKKYFSQCYKARNDIQQFVNIFAENYGDLNALHPFREGNGRAQREFARVLCMKCGYDFCLIGTTHSEMLAASKLSFNTGDSSALAAIFSHAVTPFNTDKQNDSFPLKILTADDLVISPLSNYDSYSYDEYKDTGVYTSLYKEKINKMNTQLYTKEDKQK